MFWSKVEAENVAEFTNQALDVMLVCSERDGLAQGVGDHVATVSMCHLLAIL